MGYRTNVGEFVSCCKVIKNPLSVMGSIIAITIINSLRTERKITAKLAGF